MIVTGGASGLGSETVRALARAGAEVTVATRDPAQAGALIDELAAVPGAGEVRAAAIDLAGLKSVAAFADAWRGPLDALVANAGIMALPARRLTSYGWEMQLATNYLGHFALADGLHGNLKAAGSSRIVLVGSGANLYSPFVFDDPHFERRPYDPWSAYGQSKTAMGLHAVGVAQRWGEDGITANALNPGFILTKLQRHLSDDEMRGFGVLDEAGDLVQPPHYKTPAQGAATSVLLAASPLLDGISGRYFEDNQEIRPATGDEEPNGAVAAHALDPEAADRLWTFATNAIETAVPRNAGRSSASSPAIRER
ncbi:SDR family NAD(P)-dependent oxidoreductase [Actinomadura sp. NAK00032]|nr:SDR family NAD(P)-dependent oxidoreductase [Actinomadura sp. NAK00032]